MASVTFEPLEDGDGLVVTDAIEQRRLEFHTSEAVEMEAAPMDAFFAPLDAAISIKPSFLRIPKIALGHLRGDDGTFIRTISEFESLEIGEGPHQIEFNPPIKIYVRIEGPCSIHTNGAATEFEPKQGTTISIGARSYHKRPEFTLTTTEDPEDLMEVVSHLGSALKSKSVERSFPTLRGHPPEILLGDRVDIPESLEKPNTGVTLQIPNTLSAVFATAPLAYYLAADVVPGSTPRIVTDRGFIYPLDGGNGFEQSIEQTLKQVFFLDCLTRTEGLYPVKLHEREALEDALGLDFPSLYNKPLEEQLETYLAVPFSVLEDQLPKWKVIAHVQPEPSNIENLPFLIDDLAIIRSPNVSHVTPSQAQSEAIKEFMRSEMTRSTSESSGAGTWKLVQPEAVDSQEQLWVGEDAPIGANKATIQAFRNRLNKEPKSGDIQITVVCNDSEMVEEHEDVRAIYGNREDLPFDVTLYEDLTTERLRLVLESDADFFHYIGHIEDGGFKCSNGLFDARSLDECGVNTFFLNACRSYTQGMALIESGAIGGVVTLDEVINSGAIRVGRTMARLLNNGFPLGIALELASEQSIVGSQYIVLGDSGSEVTQTGTANPEIHHFQPDGEIYRVRTHSFATRDGGMGTFIQLPVENHEAGYLVPKQLCELELTPDQVYDYIGSNDAPIWIDGKLSWFTDLEI